MKVIKNNNTKPKKASMSIVCPSCESVLQYTDDDVKHVFSRTEGWTNSYQRYVGFICPCCKYEIGIKDAN